MPEAGFSYIVHGLSVAVTALSVSIYGLSLCVPRLCPAEMLPNLQLKAGRLLVLTGSVKIRSVMFTTGLFPF